MVCVWVYEFIKVEALLKGDRSIVMKGHIEELQMVGVICVVMVIITIWTKEDDGVNCLT